MNHIDTARSKPPGGKCGLGMTSSAALTARAVLQLGQIALENAVEEWRVSRNQLATLTKAQASGCVFPVH